MEPDTPKHGSTAEVELLVFLLDGSGSMTNPGEGGTATFDGQTKAEHLFEIMQETLKRLHESTVTKDTFRFSLIYFSQEATIEEVEVENAKVKYFRSDKALEVLKNPVEVTKGGATSIVAALSAARDVLDEFYADDGMPDQKKATIFLLTDGQENVGSKDDVRQLVAKISGHPLCPIIASVSLGMDADNELLVEVASEPNERQQRHLAHSGVSDLISQDPLKLFINGHSGGEITEQQAEVIRQFVNVLSETK